MINKYLNECLYILLLLFIASCTASNKEVSNVLDSTKNLTFYADKNSSQLLMNTGVYLFDGEGSSQGYYNKRVTDIQRSENKLSMSVATGLWDISLVTTQKEEDLLNVISPIRGQNKKDLKMWVTQPKNGYLPSMPDLFTAHIERQPIVKNQQAEANASLKRNTALVRVQIVQAKGVDLNGDSFILLNKVPTTLNWLGGLYPNKDNPATSSVAMHGSFTFTNKSDNANLQESNRLEFLIPGHTGNDYLSPAPTDTTTHKLTFNIDLAVNGGTRFVKKEVEIPRVPRVNGILDVKLIMEADLEITAEVLPWVDENIDVDLVNTELVLSKASVGLAHKDTLFVNTNATDFTISKDVSASWLTVEKVADSKAVILTADLDSYKIGQPRSSFLTIKAGNITKKVPITQRPEVGTLSVDRKTLTFCPKTHIDEDLKVTSVGGDWSIIKNSDKATPHILQGSKGETNITFTRSSTNKEDDFDKYYGNDYITIKNTETLETVDVQLQNCFIYIDDQIKANAPTGTAQSSVTRSQDIKVYGGTRVIKDFVTLNNWMYNFKWYSDTQILELTTDREPDDEAREGKLSFKHADCPDYVVEANVLQDIIVTIPEFDFFVVKFTWDGRDVDIAAEFAGNSITSPNTNNSTYDKKAVGWGLQNKVSYKGKELLKWGGDATGGQGETVFFNAPIFEGDEESPRKINLDVYATWYNSDIAPKAMTFTMYAYKGGKMEQSGTNFNNTGGTLLYDKAHSVMITTTRGKENYANGGYTKVATITYDRVKHSASIRLWAGTSN